MSSHRFGTLEKAQVAIRSLIHWLVPLSVIHQLNKRLSSSQAAAVTEHAHFTRWLACALLRPPLYLPRSLSLSVCLSECVYVRARASASLSRERRKMLLSRERDGREKERDWAEERMS